MPVVRNVHFILLVVVLSLHHTVAIADRNKINIDITTHLGDVRDFQEGDRLSLLMSLDMDAYILVLYQNSTGNLIQLIPNKNQSKTYYNAGVFISLPESDAAFIFEIQPPFGRETLWAFASDKPFPDFKGRYLEDGLKQLSVDIGAIRKKLSENEGYAFGEDSLIMDTHARQ